MSNKSYSIKEVSSLLSLSEVYVRRMIQQGKLKSTLVQINDSEVKKHMIDEKDLEIWRKNSQSHSSRKDDRNKFTIYLNQEELVKVTSLLKNLNIEIERSNKPQDSKRRYQAMKLKKQSLKSKSK
jgi:excisionase family DNA binding protein